VFRRSLLALVVALAPALAACAPGTGAPSPSVAATPLTVGLGYIPDVQFAPFYYAQQQGLYAACGLNVTFQNQNDPNLVTLVGQGSVDIGLADGTSVVPAVSQGIPIRYLTTIYGTFPSIVFARTSSGITSAAALKGKKIGIPGRYGSSWVMLQALLGSANLTPDDVTIVEYPQYGQGVALQAGQVDAATGFDNNEPLQAKAAGIDVTVLRVDQVIHLPGPGLIAGTSTLATKGGAVNAFAAATLKAMQDIAAEPLRGLDASIAAVPDLAKSRATAMTVLQATIADWATPGGSAANFGAIDRNGWQATIDYLGKLGMVPKPVTVDDVIATVASSTPAGCLA